MMSLNYIMARNIHAASELRDMQMLRSAYYKTKINVFYKEVKMTYFDNSLNYMIHIVRIGSK